MEINIVEILSTVFHKVLELIIGKMDLIIEVTLSKDSETVMECGVILNKNSITKVTTCLIENMDMEFMTGEMDTYIKEILLKTKGADKVN